MNAKELKMKFAELYGGPVENLRVFSSPGRVNLIGEHTDYNGGYVFPAALTMSSTVVVRPRSDRQINLIATDLGIKVEASLDRLEKYRNLKWGNYQLGVADELQKAGFKLAGCDMLYYDTVPLGAGLSSSAAIEVVTAIALVTLGNEFYNINREIDMVELARICQKAENNYVGVNCGIMDQFASAMGKADHAVFLDCKDLSYELVPLDLAGYKLIISNTNKKRSLADSKYNERRKECEAGLNELKKVFPDICFLGEVSYEDFIANKDVIEEKVVRKRVEHVISENNRVLKSVEALKNKDMNAFGEYLVASHNSLKNLYEVTGMELDTLVGEALKIEGVVGSRMTGAGFGGCTVSIAREESVEGFVEHVGRSYFRKTGLKAEFYVSEVGDGGQEILEDSREL
jgi:galactokinase